MSKIVNILPEDNNSDSNVLVHIFLFITPNVTSGTMRKVSKAWNSLATSNTLWKKYMEIYLYYQIQEYKTKEGTKPITYEWYKMFPELLTSSFQWRRAVW
jgi:hypothetical protein